MCIHTAYLMTTYNMLSTWKLQTTIYKYTNIKLNYKHAFNTSILQEIIGFDGEYTQDRVKIFLKMLRTQVSVIDNAGLTVHVVINGFKNLHNLFSRLQKSIIWRVYMFLLYFFFQPLQKCAGFKHSKHTHTQKGIKISEKVQR